MLETPRERFLFILAIIAVAAFVLDRAVLVPLDRRIREIEERRVQDNVELERTRVLLGQEDFFLARWKEVEKNISGVPVEERKNDFFKYLEDSALEAGVVSINTTPSGGEPFPQEPGLQKLGFVIKLTCTQESLIEFLFALEKSQRLLRIESFSIVSQKGDGNLAVDMKLSTVAQVTAETKPEVVPRVSAN